MKTLFSKLLDMRKSITGRIILLFVMVFVFSITPLVLQTITSSKQVRTYSEIIDNIAYANKLSLDVNTKIEPMVWGIVSGKTSFEDSGITQFISDVSYRMKEIRQSTQSAENRTIVETSMRALSTLENYLDKLKKQIDERESVKENEILLEEIRACASGINDLLQDFSSKQLSEGAILNEKMSLQNSAYFWLNILIIGIVVFLSTFIFRYIKESIVNPIEKLLNMSREISEGNFLARVDVDTSTEFDDLAKGMNTMSEKIEILISDSVEQQQQLRKSEYRTLQAQITPHFLYNTLDTIIMSAEAKNSHDVIKLVTALSSFFRISLSSGIDFITLGDEIDHVRSYLDIQSMRYSDVLSYEINFDEDLKDMKILKLLLQPIVENALYHGIRNTRDRGKIIIDVNRQGDLVNFVISDNGIGMHENELQELRRAIKDGDTEKGYGFFNVNQRIKLYYEHTDGINIDSEYQKGTIVSFSLKL